LSLIILWKNLLPGSCRRSASDRMLHVRRALLMRDHASLLKHFHICVCMWLQSCTEMVMPVCSDGVNDMFESKPWNLTQIIADCHKRWNVSPRPHWIVEQYGGKNICAASNIIFRLDDRSVLIFCYFYPCDTILAMDVCFGGVYVDGDGGNPAECCGNTTGMDLTTAGFPRGWILLRREPRIEPFT